LGNERKRERFSLTSVGKWIRNFFVCWAIIFVVLFFGAFVTDRPVGGFMALLLSPLLSLIAVFFLWEISRG
jgi:hypothetical protein